MTRCMSLILVVVLVIGLTLATLKDTDIEAGDCVCCTEDAPMYKKAGFEHPVKRYLLHNSCAFITGENTTIFGADWYRMTVDDDLLWTAAEYLTRPDQTQGFCGPV